MGAFYLDSSALVKLVVEEAESSALNRFVRDAAERLFSSVLAISEVGRAARRAGATATGVIERLTLVEATEGILAEAVTIEPPSLRTLDALHLASALSVSDALDGFIAYDRRLVEAARASGLDVSSPT